VVDRLVDVGVPHLIFTGGEATLHPALVEVVAHAAGRGLVVGLNSNGRRLKHVPYTRALAAAGLDHVQITLESCRPEIHDAMVAAPGAFAQTVRGVATCLEAGLHTITNSTITRLNAAHVEDTVDFLHGLGLSAFAMNGMIYSGGGTPTRSRPPSCPRS
jgi:MoaA/NifB/PqqE/SkfB family radical SAM enzyme